MGSSGKMGSGGKMGGGKMGGGKMGGSEGERYYHRNRHLRDNNM